MRTIHENWIDVFKEELIDTKTIRIISPFINTHMVNQLLDNWHGNDIEVITRYNLEDFYSKASDIKAIEKLLKHNANIKGIKDLHSKVYIFDNKSTIITSANFTFGGFHRNKEFGIISRSSEIIKNSLEYFTLLWDVDPHVLTLSKVEEFKKEIKLNTPSKPERPKLRDYGTSYIEKSLGGKRYFVKFFGKGNERMSLNNTVKGEIDSSHSHFAMTFPNRKDNRRPRRFRDGDIVFIARMVEGQDYAIYGRAISCAHQDKRDIASAEDIAQRSWKRDYPIYIRVHSGEFLETTLQNCPGLSELMLNFKEYSFKSTKERLSKGIHIKPRDSLRQKAYIELSEESAQWLENKFTEVKYKYSLVPQNFIDTLYQGSLKTLK